MNAAALREEVGESTVPDFHAPGVIVFNSAVRLLFRDGRAKKLCEQIIRLENRKTAHGLLPSVVTSLAEEIHRLLHIRTETKDWEQFQVRRVAGSPDHPVLLCGFGVLDPETRLSRIMIVMQDTVPAYWHNQILDRTKERFQLTAREVEILRHLFKGWTNKEIANALNLCEQTVKEHMKHLFLKTGTTTRTGVVMRAVLYGLQYEAVEKVRDPGASPPNSTLLHKGMGQGSYAGSFQISA